MSKTNSAIAGAGTGAAVGGPWGAAVGGIAGYLGGKDDKSSDMYNQMLEETKNLPLPVLKEYYPELYKQVVSLNPEMDTAVDLGPSQMQGIATDPALRQAQLNALAKLQEVGAAGGKDAQFLADNNRVESDINSNLQGQEGAIQQDMAVRGMSGGGSELVAKNIAAQNAANRQAQMAMDSNAQAQQRALSALSQSGQLGGQMQSQDFAQQQAKAQAADNIAKFNAQNQQQVQSANVASKNQAQTYNAGQAQNVANQNTGLSNQAQQYNLNLAQQQYDNELKKRGMINQAGTSAAQAAGLAASNQDKFVGGLLDTAGKFYANQQAQAKKDQSNQGGF